MRSLLSIVERNMKVIYRSKLSTFLVLLAPILIVFLIGSAFNSNSLNNIKVGTYSPEYNELVNSMIGSMKDNQFDTEKVASADECIQKIKQGLIHVCVVFPSGITVKGSNESIKVYMDNSRMNIAYALTNSIDSKLSSKSSELGVNMVSDILKVLKEIKDSLPAQKVKVDTAISGMNDMNSASDELISSVNLKSQIDSLNASLIQLEKENLSGSGESAKDDLSSILTRIIRYNTELNSSLSAIVQNSATSKDSLVAISSDLDVLIGKLSLITANNAENIVSPIKTEINAISKDSTNWKYLYPTLVALILLLSGVVLSSSIVLTERKERARFRNFMTPTSDLSFVLGAYLTGLIILLIQMIILFAFTALLTDLDIVTPLLNISVVLILGASVFLFIGMFIGYIFKSDETTILASISFAALMIFFSNAIIPVETIRGLMKYIAFYNPFYITDTMLKKVILFNGGLGDMLTSIGILAGILVIFLGLCLFGRKMTKRSI